jgi:type IV pilus assembly protein PilA
MRHTSDRGFTLVELLMVCAVIGILAGICAHHVLRARAAANEASAIGTLRAIDSGQTAFASTCGGGYYATNLADLATDKYISPDTNAPAKSGFSIALTAGATIGNNDCAARETRSSFYAAAVPLSSLLGFRGFATNQEGTIWQDTTGIAPTEPFTQSGTVSTIQ